MNTQTVLFAAITAAALLLGAGLGSFFDLPLRLRAAMLAFGGGALVVAVAFELFEPAHRDAGLAKAAGAFALGAAVFIGADLLLERSTGSGAVGFALVAAVTLDGVPENLALGVGLAGAGGSFALLGAIVASNLPESFGGAAAIRAGGGSPALAFGIWAATAGLLALALLGGRLLAGGASPATLGMLSAFAAGAVLASLADSVMPEAFREGGPLIGFATGAGFLAAYALTTLD